MGPLVSGEHKPHPGSELRNERSGRSHRPCRFSSAQTAPPKPSPACTQSYVSSRTVTAHPLLGSTPRRWSSQFAEGSHRKGDKPEEPSGTSQHERQLPRGVVGSPGCCTLVMKSVRDEGCGPPDEPSARGRRGRPRWLSERVASPPRSPCPSDSLASSPRKQSLDQWCVTRVAKFSRRRGLPGVAGRWANRYWVNPRRVLRLDRN